MQFKASILGMWLSIHWACLLTAHPPLPERLTAYSFHCFSQPPCPHAAIYIVNLKARWWFQNLWACLLTAPPLKETHIPNLLGFNFLISNNHITSSPREAWGVFFKAYYCWNYLPPTSLDNLRTTILGIGFDQLFRETGQVSQLYSLIIKWPNYSLYI